MFCGIYELEKWFIKIVVKKMINNLKVYLKNLWKNNFDCLVIVLKNYKRYDFCKRIKIFYIFFWYIEGIVFF